LKQSAELSSYSYEQNKSYVESLDLDFDYDDDNYLYVIANTILEGDTHYIKPVVASVVLEQYVLRYFPSTAIPYILDCIYERTVLYKDKREKHFISERSNITEKSMT